MKNKKQTVYAKLYKEKVEKSFWGDIVGYETVIVEAQLVAEQASIYIVKLEDGTLKEVSRESVFSPKTQP